MTVITKLANVNQAVSETTAWLNPNNAHSSTDADASATNAPAKNEDNIRSWGFPAFDTTDIPDGSTINSVIFRYRWVASTVNISGSLGIQGSISGTVFGTEDTNAQNTTFQTSTKDITTGVALADLRTTNVVRAHMRSNRTNSNNVNTWSLDYVELEIDYTASGGGSSDIMSSGPVPAGFFDPEVIPGALF